MESSSSNKTVSEIGQVSHSKEKWIIHNVVAFSDKEAQFFGIISSNSEGNRMCYALECCFLIYYMCHKENNR
jgi:hypothetical protein